MSQTSINESVMSSKTYSLTLRTSAPDTSTALRIIRENVLRLTGKGSEEMISPLSGNAVHYIDPFSVHEVDQRKRKWDVVERLIRLEKENKGLQSEMKKLQEEMTIVNANAKEALAAHDRISNGEVINAAFALLGYTSTSKSSRPEIYRKLWRNFPLVFAWAKKRSPDISEGLLKDMVQLINPAHENPWISLRNIAAHKITVSEARASASRQGKDGLLLRKWIDLLTVDEEDATKTLDQVAFRGQLLLPSEEPGKSITDLTSFVKLLKTSPSKDLEEFGEVVRKVCQNKVKKTEVPNQHDLDIEFAE